MKLRLKKLNSILVAADPVSAGLLAAVEDGVYACDLKKPKSVPEELRRAAQNKLYWDCLAALAKTDVNELAGRTEQDWHRYMKINFLVPIYLRTKPAYALAFAAMETVLRVSGRLTYEAIFDLAIDQTSTTGASVAEFSELLSKVIHFCRETGVALKIDRGLEELALNSLSI